MLERAVDATLASDAGVVPTSALWARFGTPPDQLEAYEELKYVPEAVLAQWKASQAQIYASVASGGVDAGIWLENRAKLLKALSNSGAEVLLGSDAPQIYSVPGFSIHREMAVMAEAGLSPYEILRAGTALPGAYFMDKDAFGTVSAGARADLVLVDKNPLEDIAHAGEIAGVMLRGRWIPKSEIDDRLNVIAEKYR
jgi:imidazolonepropionase-like amidohydrolase